MSNKEYIFGLHTVTAVLQKQPKRLIRLLAVSGRHDAKLDFIIQLAQQNQIAIEYVSRQELDQLSGAANHQGVFAFCTRTHIYTEHDLSCLLDTLAVPPFLLILDGVQDPHNLGACFRTADAAGVDAIIAPKDKAVGITSVVAKVASGATESVPFVQVTNLVRTLETLKARGVWIYGACDKATQTIYATDFTMSTALVLGAEGKGLRRLTREHCDALVSIPMHGAVSSLNVAVATGVCLFEAVRQRCRIS